MKVLRAIFVLLGLVSVCPFVRGSSVIPLSTPDRVRVADAIFRGTVTAQSCFEDTNGLIYTRTSLDVDEVLKGTFPAVVQVVHRGGVVGNRDEFAGYSPRFKVGESYLVFVTRRADGTLECLQGTPGALLLHPQAVGKAKLSSGFAANEESLLNDVRTLTANGTAAGADVTDQAGSSGAQQNAVTGLLVDTNNISTRFIQCDRGEPIPYLIDAQTWPSGLTFAQATNAVAQAFNAWTTVTSLKFKLEAITNFGAGADTLSKTDGKIYIQLHDTFNRINQTNVLGVGGRGGLISQVSGTKWDLGGNVNGNDFHLSSYGYVVMESTNAHLNSASTLAEVLCHEVGHALSMAHSSETNTSDPVLQNSIMYWVAHEDGRGATLGSYDPPVIQQAYPSNAPPFAFDRVFDVTDASPQPNVPGINEIDVRGYAILATNLSVAITNATAFDGTFALSGGTKVKYTPAVLGDGPRSDPAGGGYYDLFYARVTDGTNASPWVLVKVISLSQDDFPATSDGIPDNWMQQYFGNANPATGTNHKATNDFDGDGLNNFQEYLIGSIPTNSASGLFGKVTRTNTVTWTARPYDLYEVWASTNISTPFSTWKRVGVPVLPTNTVGIFNIPSPAPSAQYFRVVHVP